MAGVTLRLLLLGLAVGVVGAEVGGPLRNSSTQRANPHPVVQEVLAPTRAPPLSYFLLPRFTPIYLWGPQANLTTRANSSTNKQKSIQVKCLDHGDQERVAECSGKDIVDLDSSCSDWPYTRDGLVAAENGVKLPSLPCERDQDCWQYTDPLLECRQGQCSCSPPFCWVYHYEASTAFTAKYVFNCGTCGILGSWCNASIACDWPGVCWSDNYCHCPRGENENNLCVSTDTSWTYKMVLIGLVIIVLFASILVAYSCYVNPPWRQPEPWCCGLCPGAEGYGRRRSIEKTPAYTLQNHYAIQESVLSPRDSEHPEMGPGFDHQGRRTGSEDQGRGAGSDHQERGAGSDDQERGAGSDDQERGAGSDHQERGAGPNVREAVSERRPRWRHRTISEVSADGEGGTSSISSLSTTVTSISEASTAVAEDPPTAPRTPVSQAVINIPPEGSDDREKVFTINLNVPLETVNFQAPPGERRSEDGSSAGSPSSSCSHERCSLCLPKGPMTRPPSVTLADGSATGSHFMIHHLQARDSVETNIVIESTHL